MIEDQRTGYEFQLTRSVGSVTRIYIMDNFYDAFQLTRSVGSVTNYRMKVNPRTNISTHTLRGERDDMDMIHMQTFPISTHTLRGERDV